MTTRTKQMLVGVTALAVLIVVVAAVVLVAALGRAEPRPPEITAYANGKAITVAPARYCTVRLLDCTEGEIAELDVPAGMPLQLSLPADIANAPWRMLSVFSTPNGELVAVQRTYEEGSALALSVVSDRDPPWQLNGVELQLPGMVVDETGIPRAHAVWAIKTA